MLSSQGGPRWWLIVPVFLLLLVYFLWDTALNSKELVSPPVTLESTWFKVETARGEIRKNQSMVGNCFICHAFWVAVPQTTENSKPRFAHANIQLNHGKNDRCYNCHHIADRNMYVADNGGAIFYQTPEKLCRRCHGLIYNDWEAGTHGKWTGSFVLNHGGVRKTYTCSECHDPHSPKFKYSVVAPAPEWPTKYIRTPQFHEDENILDGFLIEDEPREIF